MLAEERAFVKQIVEKPDNDGPRLAYSEWLNQKGDPRGKLIRVQCELALLPKEDEPEENEQRAILEARERELLAEVSKSWPQALRSLGVGVDEVTFRRGMIEKMVLEDFEIFLSHANILFAVAPTLKEIDFQNADSMTVDYFLDAKLLVASPYLSRLHSLALAFCGIGSEGTQTLAASENIQNLNELSILCDAIGDEGAHALANSKHLAYLESLHLMENEISDAGAEALASSTTLKKLKRLVMIDQKFSDEARKTLKDRFGKGFVCEE